MALKKRPTILDVAAAAGVSKSTVSLVLRNSPRVYPDKRDAVRRAIAEVGYVYNRAAAQMRSGATGMVALILDDLHDPVAAALATGLQRGLAEAGYTTMIATSDGDADHQTRLIGSMIEHGVSAIVLLPVHGNGAEGFTQLALAGVPVMQLLRKADTRTDLFPFASFDDAAGTARATRHLINQGAERIAFVGGMDGCAVTQERLSGYLAEVDRAGKPSLVLLGGTSRAFGLSALADVPSDIDALVGFNDLVAQGLLAGLARQGVAVGQAVKVAGFGDTEDCALSWPPLTSIVCEMTGFAGDVAKALVAWVQDGVPPPPEHRARVDLAARASSTGRLP